MNATLPQDCHDLKDIGPSGNEPQAAAAGSKTAPPGDGQNGRDGRGRFTPGNKGGPGNPFARRTARLRSLLLEAVTDEDMQLMAQKLVVLAKAGDLAAMKLLFGYVIGKPIPCTDPDRVDLDEWQIFEEMPGTKEITQIRDRLPIPMACVLANGSLEQNAEELIRHMRAELESRAAGSHRQAGTASSARAAHRPVAPSRNRRNGRAAPSTNGRNGHIPPSANGRNGHVPPSPNGRNGDAAPSASG